MYYKHKENDNIYYFGGLLDLPELELLDLSQGQIKFFNENPRNRTFLEVSEMKTRQEMDKEKYQQYRQSIDVEVYKRDKLQCLENLSVGTSDSYIKKHNERNSVISSILHKLDYRDTIYSEEKIKEVCIAIDTFAQKCRNEYYRIETLINEANTVDEIDQAFDLNEYASFTIEK